MRKHCIESQVLTNVKTFSFYNPDLSLIIIIRERLDDACSVFTFNNLVLMDMAEYIR